MCVGSRTKSTSAVFVYLFIYLFVYKSEVLVTWFLVWMCLREKPWFLYTVSRLCFVGGHFFFQCFTDFEVSSCCAFSSHGELKSFSFLTFSLSTFKS